MSVLDGGTSVGSVAAIERELARLRRRVGAAAPEGVVPPARAAVLNLVVYATRRAHAERAARTIAELGARHPSRAIVLFQDEGGDANEVRLTCHQEVSGGHVCFERIVVRTSSRSGHQLRSIVIPLLIPDLPVFLWWTGAPPLGSALFADLLALADRLVVDSADFARPEVTLPRLSALLAADDTTSLTDLNWARLTVWRELTAQFFDVPEWRPFLDGVSGVRIGYGVSMDGREIHPSQALLLLGWLATRLGWSAAEHPAPTEAGGVLFRMAHSDGRRLWVRLRPRFLRGADEGDVTGIRVLADAAGEHAEFVVKRGEDDTPHADTAVLRGGRTVAARRVFFPLPSIGALLAEDLSITRDDRVYVDALAALVRLT